MKSVTWQVEHLEEIPVLVVCCLRDRTWVPYTPRPSVMATSHYGSIYPSVQNLLLAARAVGLGAALITLPLWSSTVARRILELPMSVDPCCIVTLGCTGPLRPQTPKGHRRRRPPGPLRPAALAQRPSDAAGTAGQVTSTPAPTIRGVTVPELRRTMRRWREVFDDGLQEAATSGWVEEESEPGQGTDKQVLDPLKPPFTA